MKYQLELRIVRIAGLLLLFSGLLLMVISLILEDSIIAMIIGISGLVISVGGWIFFLIFWRCHVCYRWLPFQGIFSIQCCPYCGNDLEL